MGSDSQLGSTQLRRLEQSFGHYTILPIDLDTCRQWASVRAMRSKAGLPISPQDAWIAATALRYNLSLVTHNADDYQQILGLTVISEK